MAIIIKNDFTNRRFGSGQCSSSSSETADDERVGSLHVAKTDTTLLPRTLDDPGCVHPIVKFVYRLIDCILSCRDDHQRVLLRVQIDVNLLKPQDQTKQSVGRSPADLTMDIYVAHLR